MKFKELINEKFHTGIHDSGNYREVYINPTPSDIQDIFKEQKEEKVKGCRLGVDGDNNLYAWNVWTLHYTVEKKLNIKFLLKIDYDFGDGSFELSLAQANLDREDERDMRQVDAQIVDAKLHEAFPKDKQQIEKFMTAYYRDEID